MWESLRQRRVLVLIALFALSGVFLMIFERGEPVSDPGPFTAVSMQGAGVSQTALSASLRGLSQRWARHMDLVHAKEDNDRLRIELARAREERTRLLGVMQENARLRALVGFAESHPHLQLLPAKVIAVDTNEFFRVVSIRLDTGGARVRPDMPVVSSAGLVGQIETVDGRFAQVLLTVDKRSSIDVVAQRNRARGILTGEGNSNDYLSRIGYLLRRDEVRVGDTLVTSGMGGLMPADLVVGTISEVNERSYGLYQDVRVEPAVDFSRLEEVFVITGERLD